MVESEEQQDLSRRSDEAEEDDETAVNDDEDEKDSSLITPATLTLASLDDPEQKLLVKEVGDDAVWTLSSAKPGNGVLQLRDSSTETYWQSDGVAQPHTINIYFSRRRPISEIAFYLDFSLDESYTPKKLIIKAGNTYHDLEEITSVELHEPVGWVSVPVFAKPDPLDDPVADIDDDDQDDSKKEKALRVLRSHLIQICVAQMHQNGRDTHVRQVKIFGPRSSTHSTIGASGQGGRTDGNIFHLPKFNTVELSQFSSIR
jgi:anaphase-promoting complex subunit 10